jgi:hypothetical protein
MSTRAMISVAKREEGVSFSEIPERTIVDIYHHWDGYPEGLGVTLGWYLSGKKIVNGIGSKDNEDLVFNGMGCMAASIVAHLKDGPGNVYIEPRESHGWIDYYYYIWGDYGKSIYISIFSDDECIFVGEPEDLLDKYDKNY